jgi:hypothetical protein
MSDFTAEWLALREPYDLAARNPAVIDAMRSAFRGQSAISVVDLACGAGATLRAIGGQLPPRQNWRFVDNNLGLLAKAAALGHPPLIAVAARTLDLSRDLELALDGPLDLVTCSALLDLVSAEWLELLSVEAAARRLPVYAALTYDGRVTLEPAEPHDGEIVEAVNRHQRRNKGFGDALGPDAAAYAVDRFERIGYSVAHGLADWALGPDDRDMQSELVLGFAHAVQELNELPGQRVTEWLAHRQALIAAGQSSMRVGHVDVFALPMPIR